MTLIEVLTIQADHAQQSHAEVDVACKMIQRSETKYSHLGHPDALPLNQFEPHNLVGPVNNRPLHHGRQKRQRAWSQLKLKI